MLLCTLGVVSTKTVAEGVKKLVGTKLVVQNSKESGLIFRIIASVGSRISGDFR